MRIFCLRSTETRALLHRVKYGHGENYGPGPECAPEYLLPRAMPPQITLDWVLATEGPYTCEKCEAIRQRLVAREEAAREFLCRTIKEGHQR